jgi:formate hydrogenlyase subunit 4
MTAMVEPFLHVMLLIGMPPLCLGMIAKTKAWIAGRQGPSVLQPYHDLLRLLRKGVVLSHTTTWLFRVGPIGALAALLVAGLIAPLVSSRGPLGFEGDVIAFAGLLAWSRFLMVCAAFDTGSSFEAMGASRESAFAALSEPILFIVLAILCLQGGGPSFERAWTGVPGAGLILAPRLAVAVALFIVILVENSRIPFDDPDTHLELTMVHEVMVLDHSGPDYAVVLYGGAMKMLLLESVLVHALIPFPAHGAVWGSAALIASLGALSVAIGVVESWTARLRLTRVPQFLLGAFAVSAVGLLVLVYRIAR